MFANGSCYQGQFANSEFEGEGTYITANGAVYVGHFHEGLRHGYGIYRTASGRQVVGVWNRNKLETTYSSTQNPTVQPESTAVADNQKKVD